MLFVPHERTDTVPTMFACIAVQLSLAACMCVQRVRAQAPPVGSRSAGGGTDGGGRTWHCDAHTRFTLMTRVAGLEYNYCV